MDSPFEDKPNIRRYCILPARAMQDERLILSDMKVLACLGMYTNSHGVCWPSQERIMQHTGYSRAQVGRAIRKMYKLGYVRKLKYRNYRSDVQRRSIKLVNRYQVLWEGNEPLPSREQFWAPQPKLRQDDEDDRSQSEAQIKTGGLGDKKGDSHILAQAFRTTVERTCGIHRLAEPSYPAAQSLYNQGVTVEQVRDHTAAMVKDCLKKGRTPPINLAQVADWAGLLK